MSPPDRVARVRRELWPDGSKLHVYVILDGARDDRIHAAVLGSSLAHACLYAGALPKELMETAPYLIHLAPEASFTQRLLGEAWGESWGIFVLSTATLEELRRHFRRFLRVEDARGKVLIFRYYDPRVLRVYLPTCDAGELTTVFGPVSLYMMEGDEPGRLLRFHRAADRALAEDVVSV